MHGSIRPQIAAELFGTHRKRAFPVEAQSRPKRESLTESRLKITDGEVFHHTEIAQKQVVGIKIETVGLASFEKLFPAVFLRRNSEADPVGVAVPVPHVHLVGRAQ